MLLHPPHDSKAPMIGDHLALDLINTQARVDGAVVDYWHSGADVVAWLARYPDLPGATNHAAVDPQRLLQSASALRAVARPLIEQFSQGAPTDPGALNACLHGYRTAPHLSYDSAGRLVLSRIAQCDAVAAVLGPVAEAVAQLLTEGDPALIKQCAHPECVLWFYDRTKAHRRRWCSMALCGNRQKAARFRKKHEGHNAANQSPAD